MIRNKKKGTLLFTQQKYNHKVLEKFEMLKTKHVQTPLATYFRLSCQQCPKTVKGESEIYSIPQSSVVGCLMYVMVLTRPNISHDVSVISKYMLKLARNIGKQQFVFLDTQQALLTMSTLIIQVIWIKGDLSLAVCSHLITALLIGKLLCKVLWLCPQLNQNILLQQKQ